MTVTDESTAAVKEALVSLVATAKRCPRVIAKLSTDQPTMYDRRHADVDALLDRLFPPGVG